MSDMVKAERPPSELRKVLLPLALAQFICSFAGSNMNVMINDISHDLDTTVQGVRRLARTRRADRRQLAVGGSRDRAVDPSGVHPHHAAVHQRDQSGSPADAGRDDTADERLRRRTDATHAGDHAEGASACGPVSNLGSTFGTAIAGTILVASLTRTSYAAAMIVLAATGLVGIAAAALLGPGTERSSQ